MSLDETADMRRDTGEIGLLNAGRKGEESGIVLLIALVEGVREKVGLVIICTDHFRAFYWVAVVCR
jgi:hypothetical protein